MEDVRRRSRIYGVTAWTSSPMMDWQKKCGETEKDGRTGEGGVEIVQPAQKKGEKETCERKCVRVLPRVCVGMDAAEETRDCQEVAKAQEERLEELEEDGDSRLRGNLRFILTHERSLVLLHRGDKERLYSGVFK